LQELSKGKLTTLPDLRRLIENCASA